MSDEIESLTAEALSAAEAYLALLAQYKHGEDGPADPSIFMRNAEAMRLSQAVSGQPKAVREAAARKLADGLVHLSDPLVAGVAAVQAGTLVEGGVNPAPLGQALQKRLPGDFAAARRFVQLLEAKTNIAYPNEADKYILTEIGREEGMGASAWAALQYNTPAAMAAWCRHRPSRLAAKAAPGLVEDAVFLGSRGGYCWFIGELLSAADGTQLTIIAPEQRKGFVVELEVVRNAAHLFALLEDTLIGEPNEGWLEGPKADPQVAAIARGEAFMEEDQTFAIGWHYEYWWGLQPETAAQASGLHPLVAAMIGVEAIVNNLPAFRGQPLILMRPAMLGNRRCDLQFFSPLHDAQRSRVTVLQQLPQAEVDTLCEELRTEANKL